MGRLWLISRTKKYFPKRREKARIFKLYPGGQGKLRLHSEKNELSQPFNSFQHRKWNDKVKHRWYVLFTQVLPTLITSQREFSELKSLQLSPTLNVVNNYWMYSIITHWDKWKLLLSLWWAVCAPIGDEGPSFMDLPNIYRAVSKRDGWAQGWLKTKPLLWLQEENHYELASCSRKCYYLLHFAAVLLKRSQLKLTGRPPVQKGRWLIAVCRDNTHGIFTRCCF